MRRFEFSEGKSNKFWEIEVEGSSFVTRHGRIGSDGRPTTKQCGSPEAAAKQAASAIAAKLKKGYVEVGGEGGEAKPAAAAKKPAATKPAANKPTSPVAALEHELILEPTAYDDWLVYADALSSAGDPRGELITIGVALARNEGDGKALREREDALLQANADAWFGKFVAEDDWRECFGWTLETGFWGRIRFWVDYDHTGTDIAKALAYALGHPSAKFLRQLDLGLTSAEGDADYAACVRALAKHGPLPSLRRMTIGDFEFPEESEISWVSVGDIGKLWPLYPNLEALTLQGAGIGLGKVESDSLRSLVIHTGGLPGPAATSLERAKLPKLERLIVWFGTRNYGGSCGAGHAERILNNPSLANLRELAFADADFADDIARLLGYAPLPAKLERLDLSMGTMTDVGAEQLLARAGELSKLAVIDLSRNFLSPDMCARVRSALPNAQVEDQKQANDDWYYVSVGE